MKSVLWTAAFFLATTRGPSIMCAEAPAVETKGKPETQVYIRTLPEGAAVTIDGQAKGISPQLIVVPPGVAELTIEVDLRGYARQARVVEIQGGRITRVEFQMEEAKGRAAPGDATGSPDGGVPADPTRLDARQRAEAFWDALVAGRDDEVLLNTKPGEVKPDLPRMLRSEADLSAVRITTVLAGEKDACAVTSMFTSKHGRRQAAVGLTLVKEGGLWLVRDGDFLPDEKTVERFTAGFRERHLDAVPIPGSPPAARGAASTRAEERAVWEAVARFARAAAANDTALMVQLIQKDSVTLLAQAVEAREDIVKGLSEEKIRVFGIAGNLALATGSAFDSRDPKEEEEERASRKCLLVTLVKEKGSWLIRDIDLEDPEGLLDEIRRFHWAANPPSLSPVFECRLEAGKEGEVADEKLHPCGGTFDEMADLDREGVKESLSTMEEGVGRKDKVRDNGMDVALKVEGDAYALFFFDVALKKVQGEKWDDIKPTDVDPGLEWPESEEIIPVTFAVQDAAPKPTYVFRTREGSQGILQIVGVEKPRQVLLRFRLMEGAGSYLRSLFRGRLEFRIAVRKGSADPSKEELSDEESANLVKDLQARGPGTWRSRREAWGWYELSSVLSHPQGTIQGEHGGKRYVLLSQRPQDTLLTFWGESKPWCLEKASASLDAQGHALIALELDEEGARRIEKLTKAHVGRSLAVLVDDQVLTIAVIRDVLKGRLQITGLFTLAEAQAIVAVLMEGISH